VLDRLVEEPEGAVVLLDIAKQSGDRVGVYDASRSAN
jgi:hypothetical protein